MFSKPIFFDVCSPAKQQDDDIPVGKVKKMRLILQTSFEPPCKLLDPNPPLSRSNSVKLMGTPVSIAAFWQNQSLLPKETVQSLCKGGKWHIIEGVSCDRFNIHVCSVFEKPVALKRWLTEYASE